MHHVDTSNFTEIDPKCIKPGDKIYVQQTAFDWNSPFARVTRVENQRIWGLWYKTEDVDGVPVYSWEQFVEYPQRGYVFYLLRRPQKKLSGFAKFIVEKSL